MPTEMRYREVQTALIAQGCKSKQGKGDKLACLPPEGMVAMRSFAVRAKRWSGGWELHIDGVGVTQIGSLGRAEQQVRAYLETLLDIDAENAEISIVPELGGLEGRVSQLAS